ncbi:MULTISPECIES: CAP domain-containing protein [unclassified Polaromonas]|uniref:CAP domain-containing protein n=1 Tax=unclassified Polaromonas TaxID=2638319 RepID=UPI000F073CEE|nr:MULTISPECIES: CAP domain-containing protein [unclassified Polaromonas]AYQ29953.1 CAP domain-containing protein [Polaromonas sp. SP1]QGJ18930.1 CAP domain-containing protein [Polaromonas sp. Pch-P]
MHTPATPTTRPGLCWHTVGCSVLAAGLITAGPAHAQPAEDHPALLRALNTLRQQGCSKGARPATPLRENAALSRAAARMAAGSKLDDALKSAGYRAVRVTQITVKGASGAAALTRSTLGSSCSPAMHGELQDAGFHQRGTQTWVLLAARFSPPDAADTNKVEARVLALVNEARARPQRCGNQAFAPAPPLRLNDTLQSVASGHAAEMARYSYFSHTGRDGSNVDGRATEAGYPWRNIGENIAAGQTTADAAVQGWIKSPGHCANIMSPAYSEMGVAFVVSQQSSAGIYWAQVFGARR